jgi:hypothetical protein
VVTGAARVGAIATAVDIPFVLILDAIRARLRKADRVRPAGEVVAIRVGLAVPSYLAARAIAAAVDVCLVLISDLVIAARGLAQLCAADLGGAVSVDPAERAIRTKHRTIAAAIHAALVAVAEAVVASWIRRSLLLGRLHLAQLVDGRVLVHQNLVVHLDVRWGRLAAHARRATGVRARGLRLRGGCSGVEVRWGAWLEWCAGELLGVERIAGEAAAPPSGGDEATEK